MYIHQLHFCVLFRLYIDRCTQGIWMNLECEVVVKTSHKKVSDRQRPSGIIYMCLKLKGVPQKSTGHDENKGGNHDKPLDWMGGVLNFSVMHLSFYRFFCSQILHMFFVFCFFLAPPRTIGDCVIRCSSHHVKRLARCPGDLIRRRVLIGSNRSSWVARRNSRRPSLIVFWWPKLESLSHLVYCNIECDMTYDYNICKCIVK